jgi:hypothetical protein
VHEFTLLRRTSAKQQWLGVKVRVQAWVGTRGQGDKHLLSLEARRCLDIGLQNDLWICAIDATQMARLAGEAETHIAQRLRFKKSPALPRLCAACSLYLLCNSQHLAT